MRRRFPQQRSPKNPEQIEPPPRRPPERHTVLVFYVGGRERPGLGMDVHPRVVEEPAYGRLVVEDARKLLARLEDAIGRAERGAAK